jgi:hypothetical protein
MLWRLIFAALSFSFISTGYTVLTDPTCQRVSLSGVRLIEVACSAPGSGFSAALVGWVSLIVGLIALLINLGILVAALEERVRARKPHDELQLPNENTEEDSAEEVKSSVPPLAKGLTFLMQLTPLIMVGVLVFTFVERHSQFNRFNSVMETTNSCNQLLQAESDFNQAYKNAQLTNDYNQIVLLIGDVAAKLSTISNTAPSGIKEVIKSESDAYSNAVIGYKSNNQVLVNSASSQLNANGAKIVSLCAPNK